jgi:predicted DNA-binding transcriptional regulator AlpA
MHRTDDPNDLIAPETAARNLGVTENCLAKWRCCGGGPRFVKIGRRVRYRRTDLDAFITERVRASTSDTEPACRRA